MIIQERLTLIGQNIARVCQKTGKDPKDITLVGVTKYATADDVKTAVGCGLAHIGENKVRPAQDKFSVLEGLPEPPVKHMIGHLQTNKVRAALALFDVIQSVDTPKLAQVIEKEAAAAGKTIRVLVQVNTSGEPQKFGTSPAEAARLVHEIAAMPHIRVEGLMTIAPMVKDVTVIRRCFRGLRELFEDLGAHYPDHERVAMKYLSMGMTDDYQIALEEGANMVRLGRAIFSR